MRYRALVFMIIGAIFYASLIPEPVAAVPVTKTLQEGTRVYVVLDQRVSGKRGEAEVGQLVKCHVWRDVVVGGNVLISAGSPVVAKIDSIKHANIAGVKGKMSLAAYETKAVDGQTVQLSGGYMKAGKSRMALSISLGAILFVPLIFIPGKAAELPQGMVYDVFTGPDMTIHLPSDTLAATSVVDLSNALSGFSAEVLMDNLQQEKKPEVFQIKISGDGAAPTLFVIDSVNSQNITALPLTIKKTDSSENGFKTLAEIKIKTLAKHFQRGINRFEISYESKGERIGCEVILNVQM